MLPPLAVQEPRNEEAEIELQKSIEMEDVHGGLAKESILIERSNGEKMLLSREVNSAATTLQ